MSKKYKGFTVDFVSKGIYSNELGKYKIKGKAYYLFKEIKDENDIIDYKIYKQFIQIEYANFRPTDKEMLTTEYYKNLSTRNTGSNLRFDILEKIQVEKGFNKNHISKDEKIRIEIELKYIKEINKELLKENRIKRSIDLFTGSNSSGAKSDYLKTDIISLYKGKENYDISGLNFTNPLNYNKIFKEEKIQLNSVNEIELISFRDYLNLNKEAKKLIYDINVVKDPLYLNIFNQEYWEPKALIDEIILLEDKKEYDNLPKEIKTDSIDNLIQEFLTLNNGSLNNKEELNKFVNKLRNIQRVNIKHEIKHLKEKYKDFDDDYFINFVENSNAKYFGDHAHIIPVSQSKKDWKTLIEIADNSNCLLLNKDLHYALDRANDRFFDTDGFLKQIDIQTKEIKETRVKIKNIFLENKKRIQYLLKYKNMIFNNHKITK